MRSSKKLPKKEVEKMFFELCNAIAQAKTPLKASELLQDLLSYPECEMIAKRLKIAEYLMSGKTYSEISEMMHVSSGTIARVGEWLEQSGSGYRAATQANQSIDVEDAMDRLPVKGVGEIKKRYPMYHWPELLVEHLIVSANKKQQAEIRSVIKNLDATSSKGSIFNRIEKLMRSQKK